MKSIDLSHPNCNSTCPLAHRVLLSKRTSRLYESIFEETQIRNSSMRSKLCKDHNLRRHSQNLQRAVNRQPGSRPGWLVETTATKLALARDKRHFKTNVCAQRPTTKLQAHIKIKHVRKSTTANIRQLSNYDTMRQYANTTATRARAIEITAKPKFAMFSTNACKNNIICCIEPIACVTDEIACAIADYTCNYTMKTKTSNCTTTSVITCTTASTQPPRQSPS